MPDKTKVIFLDYFEDLGSSVHLIDKACEGAGSKIAIVSSNYDTRILTDRYKDFAIVYFDDLLPREDYGEMDKYVFNLTETWHKGLKKIENVTEHNGIRFGCVAEEAAQRIFSFRIRNLEIVLKIIRKFNPSEIIFIGEKDALLELSIFTNNRLNIRSFFIKAEVKKKSRIVKKISFSFCRVAAELFMSFCDGLMRRIVLSNKNVKEKIIIDNRLYFESRDLYKDFYPSLYIIEKGARARIKLLKDEKVLYIPLLLESFFAIPHIFSKSYGYWKSIRCDGEFRKIFNYKGLDIWSLVEKDIMGFFLKDFNRIRKNLVFLDKLYERFNPKLIVLREAVRESEKTIVLAARNAGVATMVIQHGLLAEDNVYTHLHADKIALWGSAGIEWYSKYGNEIEKCVVTGKPLHDLTYRKKNLKQFNRKDVLKRAGADPDKDMILFIPGYFQEAKLPISVYMLMDSTHASFEAVLKIAECFPEKEIIVKLHPYDPVDIKILLNSGLKKYKNIFIVKDIDIIDLIYASSLVITSIFSSAALDAVILDKPIITLNMYKRDDYVPFAQRGVALRVDDKQKACEAAREALEDAETIKRLSANRESFIRDYAYKVDGNAAKRVKDLIERQIA